MKATLSALSLMASAATWTIPVAKASFLGGTEELFPTGEDPRLLIHRRKMQQIDADFQPLPCNANLDKARCVPWSTLFGHNLTWVKRIVIPCGTCVTMDLASGGTLTLNDGLDIQGKLVFPDNGYRLTVYSTLIAVQGELVMISTSAVNGNPSLHVILTGQDDQYFSTADSVNKNACNGGSMCYAGKKVIVIAGGQVTSKYFDEACEVCYYFH